MREAATDDGSPREPSPFWDEVAAVFEPEDVERATSRRPLSALTWPLESAPTDRERLRSLARLAVADPDEARALADANDWQRRLSRARGALQRDTRIRPEFFGGKTTFGVTELERFADCSSAWLIERIVSPKTIDAEVDPLLRGSVAHSALHKFYAGLPKELGHDRVTPENLDRALGFLRRCLDDALRGGVRLDLTELQEAELDESLWRDLEGFVRDEAASELALLPRRFEVSFGSDRSAPELQRGLPLGDGLHLSGKIDRIDVDPFSARGIVQDYKSGRTAHSAKQIDEELKLQIPLYMLVLRDLVGIEPLGGVYRALAGARVTRGLLLADADDDLPGYQRNDYLRGRRLLGARRDLAQARARLRPADPRRRRAARPEGRRVPRLVRSLVDVPGEASVNPEQRAAVEARGEVFVSAGAGTGKTTVLVERFVRAVCDEGLDVESVLVITYTRKAAGELRARIRAALHRAGRPDLARRLDGAWISTIHGFCSRLLRAHPFAVGIDPRFRELDEEHGAVLRGESFERALAAFCSTRDPERLRLLATYGAPGLRRMLTGVYETLRSAGRELVLELGDVARVPERLRELQAAADALLVDPKASEKHVAAARAALALVPQAEQLLDLSHLATSGERAAEFKDARQRLEQAALDELAERDRDLLQELLELFATEYAEAKRARVGARLRGPAALRARPAARPRGRAVGGAAPLPRDHGRRVPGHEPPAVRPRRPAARRPAREGRLLRRRRVPVDLRLPPRRRRRLPRAP